MIHTRNIFLSSAVLMVFLFAACSPTATATPAAEQDASPDARRFSQQASQTLQRIKGFHELLSSDLDSMSPAEQDEEVRAVQDAIGDDMVVVQTMAVPEYLDEARQQLNELLLSEQHIWEHMALYALSGEAAQWSEAKLEAGDVDLEARRLTSEVNGLLEMQGVETASLLPEFALPSPPVVAAASEDEVNTEREFPTDYLNDLAPEPAQEPPDVEVPNLTLTGGVGDIIIQRFQDRDKNPALVAHWSMDVDPGELMLVDYPFVSGDKMEMSVYGHRLDLAYMEAPSGERILEVEDLLRPWRGYITTTEDGWYRIYLDNTQGDSVKNMHVLITYHDEAPDSIHLPDGVDDYKVLLPIDGS